MQPTITSPQNQRVKDAARLRERRGRKVQGRIIIDGAREVLRALEAHVEVSELFLCEELIRRPEASRAVELSKERGIELLRTTPKILAKLSFGQRAEGVVAIAKPPQTSWPAEKLPDDCTVIVLEHVEKPGNLGGVIRTADAAGIHAIFVADTAVDVYSPNAIRSSLGTVFSQPIISAAAPEILRWLRDQAMAIFAARVDGAIDYWKAEYRGRVALVLGSEAEGLSSLWSGPDIRSVALPMLGQADSLNVSVTAAVLIYEALRQKRQ